MRILARRVVLAVPPPGDLERGRLPDYVPVPTFGPRMACIGCPPALRLRYSERTQEDGVVMLKHACRMGLEGIVSKWKALPTDRDAASTG